MRGGRQLAKPDVARPLDGRVRRASTQVGHLAGLGLMMRRKMFSRMRFIACPRAWLLSVAVAVVATTRSSGVCTQISCPPKPLAKNVWRAVPDGGSHHI